jgi:ketosteroid isomerase-like protein
MRISGRSNVPFTRGAKAYRVGIVLILLAFCATVSSVAQQTENEKAVWKLENNYWEYVKALDMDNYKALWHENFVGWPYSSSQPARKDHITDWIKAHTDKGATLAWFELKPADSRATENFVVTEYWLTSLWADKAGHGEPLTTRVTHTWIKTANGWQIIGGMSAVVPAD